MENNFDLVVIGGGPGGYVCAIRASQLGLKTACVESRGALGGTCLNVGCIPSKSLLNLSENYHKAKKDFNQQGIEIDRIKLNIDKMMSNKNKSIQVLTKGVEFLFKKNKVTYFKGKGVLLSKNDIVVYESNNKRTNIKSKNIVIATGSTVSSLPGIEINEKNVVYYGVCCLRLFVVKLDVTKITLGINLVRRRINLHQSSDFHKNGSLSRQLIMQLFECPRE